MIKYILDNSLYNSPIQSNSFRLNKRLKLDDEDNVTKLNFKKYLSIESIYIQEQLINLSYIDTKSIHDPIYFNKLKELLDHEKLYLKEDEINDNLKSIYKLVFNYFIDSNNIKLAKKIFGLYLWKYDEMDEKLMDGGLADLLVWEHVIRFHSLNGLMYLLRLPIEIQNELKSKYINIYRIKPFNNTSKQDIFKFIKLYLTAYSFINHPLMDDQIIDFIFSIQSIQDYELLSKSIVITTENSNFTNSIPSMYHSIPNNIIAEIKNSKRIKINDQKTIDSIYNGFDFIEVYIRYINLKYYRKDYLFKFHSHQLIQYARELSIDKPIFTKLYSSFNIQYEDYTNDTEKCWNDLFIKPFLNAINNCDIISLEQIAQLLSGNIINIIC